MPISRIVPCVFCETVTCRGLVLLNWSGSKRESGIIISFRGDLDSTGGCSQIVRLFSTVQGQIPHGGS